MSGIVEPPPILEVEGLTMRFGGLTAVGGVSFQARRGQITAPIGPNGAGKSTVLRALSGMITPWSGTVWFDGRDVTAVVPARSGNDAIDSVRDAASHVDGVRTVKVHR